MFSADELLESLGQAVIATDLDGVVVSWNRAAERLYGWSAAEAIGRNITDVTVPQVSQGIADEIMAALRDGVPWSGGFPVQRRDGTVFHALVTDALISRDGRPVGIVGVSTDLGPAVQALLEHSSDAALLLTADGHVTYASPAVTRLFGWTPADVVAGPLAVLVHPDDRPLLAEELVCAGRRRVLDLRVRGIEGWVWCEAALANLVDDPMVRATVCNLHYSERLAQLEERDRVSEALHSDVLQSLFGAGLELESLPPTTPGAERARISAALEAINAAIRKLRTIVQPTTTRPRPG